jgi:hypothetical protein
VETTLLLPLALIPFFVLVLVMMESKGNVNDARARPTVSELKFTGSRAAH